MLLTIIVFLLILSVLVLVHEAGHFIVAKIFKIKVEEFGFGLPPRAFGKKFGETLYSINWLPIGGFVKLYGEDEAGSGTVSLKPQEFSKKDSERAYFSRPKWQKALVVSAGVFMNFVLAVVIISFLFSAVGVPTPTGKVFVTQVVKNSPADKAGLLAGDLIVGINGKEIKSTQEVLDSARLSLGKPVDIKIQTKKGIDKTLKLTPRKVYPKDQGPMGVAIEENLITKKYPWYQAPFVGTKEALKETWMIASGLGLLFVQLVTKGVVPSDVAGPVGIAQLTGRVVDIGPYAVLSFISLLSLNLAIINILPIPALDGGRLFFIVWEAVTRKKVNPKLEGYAHTIGMAILLGLILLITLHDLFRIFTGQQILPK
ncbi:MAG TPA: M50 family metallopeptidase [Candidatus Sulfotelmatobacter sp.]|nr:M50 family metallopeptidase [Candidatus Sulfotelmatobacter sp.]